MNINDKTFLKTHSISDYTKFHFKIDHLHTRKDIDIMSNVYTIHILNVFNSSNLSYVLKIIANDIEMDSIMICSTGNINNISGLEYEKKVQPIAKLTRIEFKVYNMLNEEVTEFDLNVSVLIRFFKPNTEFNDNFNELNPEYNPHYIPSGSESGYDSEY